MMDEAQLDAYFHEHYTATAYRWEALPVYEVASDGNEYSRYLAGADAPDLELIQPWLDELRADQARGLYQHRVRLLRTPLGDYEKYECEWGYELTGPAGEDIRVIDLAERPAPTPMPDHDYWLLDDQHPVRMHYGPTGEFLGATVEPDLLDLYRTARDAAWAASEPFEAWWARHPEHHRDQR